MTNDDRTLFTTRPDDRLHVWRLRHGWQLVQVQRENSDFFKFYLRSGDTGPATPLAYDSVVGDYEVLRAAADEIRTAVNEWIDFRLANL